MPKYSYYILTQCLSLTMFVFVMVVTIRSVCHVINYYRKATGHHCSDRNDVISIFDIVW